VPAAAAMGFVLAVGGWPVSAVAGGGQFGMMAPGIYGAAGVAAGAGKQQHGGVQRAGGSWGAAGGNSKPGWSK
jgi:hypothetical protein